jgi:ADP-ribosylglycohydrolase
MKKLLGVFTGTSSKLFGVQHSRKSLLNALDRENPFKDVGKMITELNSEQYSRTELCSYSILPENAATKARRVCAQQLDFTEKTDRALAIMLANAIGDALGAPLEFSALKYNAFAVRGFNDTHVWTSEQNFNAFGLEPGQWTDDFSMAYCLADSLIMNNFEFNPIDSRLRFACWWRAGYCNAFGFVNRQRPSVGLGGNISLSLSEFLNDPTIPYTRSGDMNTNGNGSIMRNSPIPTLYHHNMQKAMDVAYKQSKNTHQGEEAAELCRLLTFVCIKGIETGDKQKVFEALHNEFESALYSIQCLAKSMQEERHDSNQGRELQGAVCAQIAGAIYGLSCIPKPWIEAVQQWDRHGDILLKSYYLYNKIQ